MKIFFNSSYQHYKANQKAYSPTFEGRGKPIDLKYIYEKHQDILPPRVLEEVKKVLSNQNISLPSLMQIHKSLYLGLLDCKTLNDAKKMFSEFSDINDIKIAYQKRSFKDANPKFDVKDNFGLRMLQEYWAKLRTQDDIAKDFGLKSRATLDWSLKKINFPGFVPNYKNILKASDADENKLIAAKTAAWNALHPDLMFAKNKHAAQAHKRPERRAAQAEAMKKFYVQHPERKEKISCLGKLTWAKCPEVAEAMADFAKRESNYTKFVIQKDINGQLLTEREKRAKKGFYSRFWKAYPELKAVYQEARKLAAEEIKK